MYAYRQRDKIIDLAPGQERLFRLPPISQGTVLAKVYDADVTEGPHGELSEHIGLADDLEVTLIHPGIEVTDANSVRGESLWNDLLWHLRLRRDGNATSSADPASVRQYRVRLQYPSQLPIVERRISARFFQRGFDENWNRQDYVRVKPDERFVYLYLDQDFADAFGIDENPYRAKDLGPGRASGFNDAPIVLGVGAGPLPGGGQLSLFVSVRVSFAAGGRISAYDTTDADFPAFSVIARLYLTALGGTLACVSAVDADTFFNALDDIDGVDGEEKKREAEASFSHVAAKIGGFVQPWLLGGDQELYEVAYEPGPGDVPDAQGISEPATGQLIVRYVGEKPRPVASDQPLVAGVGQPIGEAPPTDTSEPLFSREEMREEEPDPLPAAPVDTGDDVLIDTGGPFHRHRRVHRSPPIIGALEKIEHIVVLMMENRSFDQMLGYLSRENGRTDVDGLNNLPPDPATNPQVNRYDNLNYFPQRAQTTAWPSTRTVGPGHDTDDVMAQMQDDMGGFVKNWAKRIGHDSPYLRLVMDYFGPDQLPVYALLAQQFAICDRWFCAHAGPTWPNRFILLTGDLSADRDDNVEPNNPDMKRMLPRTTPTLLDYLTDKEVDWRVFEHGYSFPRLHGKYTFEVARIVPFDDPDIGFEATARNGLPPVTFIEPDYIDAPPGNDDHPPADVADGQELVGRVMKMLVSSPSWDKTLFIITYDEHGGFYDHVIPPDNAPPLRGSISKLGPRVPAFVISPYIEPGAVLHTQFDHTSIGATIMRRFCGPWPPGVSPRMAAAADVREALTRDTPRPPGDFAAFRDWQGTGVPSPRSLAFRAEKIGQPDGADDSHWLLNAVRLMTGNP